MVRELGELMRDDVVALAAMRLAVEVPAGGDDRGPTYDAWAGSIATVISHAVARATWHDRPGHALALPRRRVHRHPTASFASSRLEDLLERLRDVDGPASRDRRAGRVST